MRKSIIAILSLVAMVACTNDVTVNAPAPVAIGFEGSFVEAKTRAAVDPSITTATIDAFDVWGYMENASGIVFEQQRVTKGAAGWTYEPLQYWMPKKNYFFHAVAPVDDANIVIDTKDVNTTGLGKITFTNVEGATDLLYTSKHVETDDTDPYYENAATNNKVSLQFMHLLSKIKFSFTNGFATENTTLKVKNITITDAPKVGEIYVNTERNNFVWNITQETTTVLNFGDINGGEALAAGASDECADERLTIPADETRSYTIKFDVELYYGTELGMSVSKVVSLENQKFEIGKNYNIKATIDHENIADEALKPIEFDVIEVEDWVEGIFNGKFDDEDDTQNPGDDTDEPVAPTALATPEVTAVAKENTVTLTWEAVENAASYSITVGTEMPVVTEDTTYTFTGEYETEYTFNVVAVPADEEKFAASEAGVATATTEAAPVVGSDVVLYLQPNANWNADGARFAAYMWNDGGNNWLDMTLADGETNVYTVTVPAGYDNIIFVRMNPGAADNNWDNKWNQTDDLKVPTDGTNLYTVPENTWDKGDGVWSVYTPSAVEPEEPAVKYTTVAEFLAADVDDATFYTLKGTITRVANTSYGNFDLTDETGTIYVYGLYSEDGATNKYWAASGAKLGDDIVISAVRADYNGQAQAGSARFLGLTSPGTLPFWSFSKTATTFTSAGGEQVITVDAYNLTDSITVASDNAQFSAAYADGALTITALENATTETINGNITVTAGALEQVITVAQGGASVGGGTEVVAEATMKSFGWANAAVIKTPFKLDDNVSVTVAQNTAGTAPTYYTNGEALRLYQNGATMTVTANGKTIKAIEFTFNGTYTYLETATPTYAAGKWTGEATEVTFSTPKSSDKAHRAYITAIKVTYVD